MKKIIAITLTAFLFMGFAPLIFATGLVDGIDFVEDGCNENDDGTDVDLFVIECVTALRQCLVGAVLCDDSDNKAKYRVHFDTQAPLFYQGADCETTSDDTAMYRPRSAAENDGRFTGPDAAVTVMKDDLLVWIFDYEALGVIEGDYMGVWLDIHKKGIQDRAPNTDDTDGCAKPRDMFEVLNIMIPLTNGT